MSTHVNRRCCERSQNKVTSSFQEISNWCRGTLPDYQQIHAQKYSSSNLWAQEGQRRTPQKLDEQ